MNNKQRKTLELIFKDLIPKDIRCQDIESLFKHLDAELVEGTGSRIHIKINGRKFYFHRPHPSPMMKSYVVKQLREFLIEIGVKNVKI